MPDGERQLSAHPGVARRLRIRGHRIATLDTAASGDVEERGTALLLPGFTGSKEDFAPLLGPLSRLGWRTVAVDLPGQYESTGPAERSAYTVDALAQTVLDVAGQLAVDGPIDLLGHSFGGLVARAAVLARPDRWASLTLLDSGPGGIAGRRRAELDRLEPLLATGGMAAVYAATEHMALADPDQVALPADLKEFLRRRFFATSPASLSGMADALRTEPDLVDALRATGVPVLVCCGAADDAWPTAVQMDMALRLGAEHVVIPDAMHSPAIQDPGSTLRVLVEFWSRTSRISGTHSSAP